jgi:ribosome maturation factor RimP
VRGDGVSDRLGGRGGRLGDRLGDRGEQLSDRLGDRGEQTTVLEEVRDLAEAITRRRSLELYDVEVGGRPGQTVVRVFVEREGGVDLDTVSEVSEELSRGLDLKDPIPGRYTLEVSTPGVERRLRRPEHFASAVGQRVVVKTEEVLFGDSHRLEGEIASVGEDSLVLAVGSEQLEVPFSEVRSARTVFEW